MYTKKREILKALKDPVFKSVSTDGFVVSWWAENLGFGDLTFYTHDGKLKCDTECMSEDFARKVMAELLDSVEFK